MSRVSIDAAQGEVSRDSINLKFDPDPSLSTLMTLNMYVVLRVGSVCVLIHDHKIRPCAPSHILPYSHWSCQWRDQWYFLRKPLIGAPACVCVSVCNLSWRGRKLVASDMKLIDKTQEEKLIAMSATMLSAAMIYGSSDDQDRVRVCSHRVGSWFSLSLSLESVSGRFTMPSALL